jgi:hypothetical protein
MRFNCGLAQINHGGAQRRTEEKQSTVQPTRFERGGARRRTEENLFLNMNIFAFVFTPRACVRLCG